MGMSTLVESKRQGASTNADTALSYRPSRQTVYSVSPRASMPIMVRLWMIMLAPRMTEAIVNIAVFWKQLFLSMMARGAMSSRLGMSAKHLTHALSKRATS